MNKILFVLISALFAFSVEAAVLPSLVGLHQKANMSTGMSYDYGEGANLLIYGEVPFAKYVPGFFRVGFLHGKITAGLDTRVNFLDSFHLGVYSSAAVNLDALTQVNLYIYPYGAFSFIFEPLLISVWSGIEFLEALNNRWDIFVGTRVFYKPFVPAYLQLEGSLKSIIVAIGIQI